MSAGADIIVVAGARPNFIKIAPLLRAFRHRAVDIELVHTGQHYDFEMSGVFFEQLGIPTPDAHLQVGSGTHAVQTAAIMTAFDVHLDTRTTAPTDVVVVGDVNSTMACALVAVKRGIRVTHVEAGLRSFDRGMPEEINRCVTDAVAALLLVSEPAGLANLQQEGVPAARVRYVGNVMIDTLVAQLADARALDMPGRLGVTGPYVVVTLHRPSNVDDADRLRKLVAFLVELASAAHVVFPIHPRTRSRIVELGLLKRLESARVVISAPLGYREFLSLLQGAQLVVSDSGGVQEETAFLDVPCLTLRTNTERPITTTMGTNQLVGTDYSDAMRVAKDVLAGQRPHARPIEGWDGHAAIRAVDAILDRNNLVGTHE